MVQAREVACITRFGSAALRPLGGQVGGACQAWHRAQAVNCLYQSAEPDAKTGTVVSDASPVWRFLNEIQDGDWVVTYSPANRLYSIGRVRGPAEYHPEWAKQGLSLTRTVQWQTQELQRDSLSTGSKNSLGSTLNVFAA